MAMSRRRKLLWLYFLEYFVATSVIFLCLSVLAYEEELKLERLRRNRKRKKYGMIERIVFQEQYLKGLTIDNDTDCINALRMDTGAFRRLCDLLHTPGGLRSTKHVSFPEQVAMFLMVLSHHTKNRMIALAHKRSGETVSKAVHSVLLCLLRIRKMFLVELRPVTEDCDVYRWKCFQGCVGALDGTYIPVHVPEVDKPRYRSRKQCISINMLGACDMNMCFTYAHTGWEGNAHDGRVLRDAMLSRGGIKIPHGTYYLCDNGYTNGEGFLAPYRGVRYHLKEWAEGEDRPANYKEYFNMRHSRARNVIERTFGNLKQRWGILRSCSYYPIKTQNNLILACVLVNNFIRMNMSHDYLDDEDFPNHLAEPLDPNHYVDVVEATNAWSMFRDQLAQSMYAEHLEHRRLGLPPVDD